MNLSRPFTRSTQKTFRNPLEFLDSLSKKGGRSTRHRKTSSASLDGIGYIDIEAGAPMEASRRSHSSHNSESELQSVVPLIDIGSRSTSPYPRNRSAIQSDDEDDDYDMASSIRPLVSHDVARGSFSSGFFHRGGPGAFFFGTWQGRQVWTALLVFWVGGCSFGLLLMNRFIMLTGIYKFPYPLSETYLQLIITHVLLILVSSLLRALTNALHFIGFGAAVPPSQPSAPPGGAYRGTRKSGLSAFPRWLSNGSGGIAGGGLFEFDWQVARQVIPLMMVFVVRVLLSNFSFAYAPLPIYQLARIGITPLAIIFSCMFQGENLNGGTLSAALVATLNLFFASYRTNVRVTWESVVAGVFSSLFVALHPILLLRTYDSILAGLLAQHDAHTGYPTGEEGSNREETRAFFRTLHYTSLLSLMFLTPIVLISGEVQHIYHNIPFLDVPFFWAMNLFGGMGSWAVFSGTLLLVKATSPLATTFVAVPRSAFQLGMISLFNIPPQSWIGVILCWLSSAWFLLARRSEGRSRSPLKLEGR